MQTVVHRGLHQIGGSITEIFTDTTRIFVDFGSELSVSPDMSTDDKMVKYIQDNPPNAVLFTHIHGDHIGLLSQIPSSVEIFIGAVARQMMLNIRETLLKINDISIEERKKLQAETDILLDEQRTHIYENWTPTTIGDIIFIPIRTDHSVYDAYMLKFQADGKTILHTGDFRTHGRMGEKLLSASEPQNIGDIDILVTEGTMMSRQNEKALSERQMEEIAIEIMKKHKYAFLICSSTNMESLASFYRATIASGFDSGRKPPFIVNGYVKRQLDLFTKEVGEKEELHEFTFYRSYAIKEALKQVLSNGKTQKQHMIDEGFLMMVGTSDYYRDLMEEFRDYNPVLLYSMWDGYLQKDKEYSNPELISLVDAWKGNCIHLHTSGHATAQTIADLITLINPKEAIIPIHTENAKGFLDLDISDELKGKIKI